MTKKELVKKISASTGYDRKCVAAVADSLMDGIKDSVIGGEAVYLRGFGTFERKRRAPKPARDMRAGATIRIPAHDVPHFRPCEEFKNSLR